jgi:transposase-like protein
MDDILAPRFIDPVAARKHLEALRWPDGPECVHCGSADVTRLEGKKHRDGLLQCNHCREQFTVTVGTVFERSKIPLNKWLLCNHLLCAGKKGVSAHQIHRMLGITYKTAWFMCHRLREAMKASWGPQPYCCDNPSNAFRTVALFLSIASISRDRIALHVIEPSVF